MSIKVEQIKQGISQNSTERVNYKAGIETSVNQQCEFFSETVKSETAFVRKEFIRFFEKRILEIYDAKKRHITSDDLDLALKDTVRYLESLKVNCSNSKLVQILKSYVFRYAFYKAPEFFVKTITDIANEIDESVEPTFVEIKNLLVSYENECHELSKMDEFKEFISALSQLCDTHIDPEKNRLIYYYTNFLEAFEFAVIKFSHLPMFNQLLAMLNDESNSFRIAMAINPKRLTEIIHSFSVDHK